MVQKFFQQKNKSPKPLNLLGGFTLVETLVAISIFTMSILGLMSVLTQGIVDIGYAKEKVEAGYLAQEGIEYMRNMRDNYVLYASKTGNDWNKFKADIVGKTYPITDLDFARFNRTISATVVQPDEIKITSTVSWNQGSGNYHITFSENLYNWWE